MILGKTSSNAADINGQLEKPIIVLDTVAFIYRQDDPSVDWIFEELYIYI